MDSQWISVKDKLPERGVGVLITDGRMVTCAEFGGTYQNRNGEYISWNGHEFGGYEWEFDFDEGNITHWMSLPQPPQTMDSHT